MAPPKVFISYSHDSPAHEAKVLALSNRLRGNGIDAVVDQYEPFPPRGWIEWMKHQVRDAQFILVVCTETYRRRWDGAERAGEGLGAIYEGQLIQQLLYEARGVNERFVPVLLSASDGEHSLGTPSVHPLSPLHRRGYEALYRLLTNQPKIRKPILGQPLACQGSETRLSKSFLERATTQSLLHWARKASRPEMCRVTTE
jgi:hypothetical protein